MLNQQQTLSSEAIAQLAAILTGKVDPALLGAGTGKLSAFLTHVGSASPRACDASGKPLLRWQDRLIEQEIAAGASVLDLGCGAGELLRRLIDMKQVKGQGLEKDPESVMQCIERKVPVLQSDLDEGLKELPDSSFDYVILEETLQTLLRPAEILEEMLRVGCKGIVSFPNFGYWRVRLDLGIRGRMPVTEWLPHHWFDTPNIHLFTLQDFLDWADKNKVTIVEGYVLVEGAIRAMQVADNLYAEEALLVVERG